MIGLICAVIVFVCGIVLSRTSFPPFDKIAPIIGTVLAIVMVAASCASYVPTGYTGILTTFGRVEENKNIDAGITFHAPWQKVVTMDNREQRGTFQLEAFSKDIQQVDIQGSINYNIDKSTAMRLYRDVGLEYVSILVSPRIQEDVKIVVAHYTAENLVANRQAMANEIEALLREELSPKGVNVISLAVENIDFQDSYERSIEAKQVATQEKLRAQTEQEQKTMEAEQAAKRQKIEAEAAAEVQRINAEAEAYAIKAKADAEAEANKKINASLTDELISYVYANGWDGKLPVYTGGENIPILNLNGAE